MPNNEKYSVAQYLETLEDTTLYTKKSRMKSFECLKSILDDVGSNVTPTEVQRILNVFVDCMKEDIQCLPHAISAVSSLLNNSKIISITPYAVLLGSAIALLHMLRTKCVFTGTLKLRDLSLDLLVSYPIDVLSTLVTQNCELILEMFIMYRPKGYILVTRELCVFLQKLLTLLPSEQKKQIVSEGVSIWFSDFMPTVMHLVEEKGFDHNTKTCYVQCLETLTEELATIDYFHCEQWQNVLFPCICDAEKYPLIIQNQLQSGSDLWHRLWIVFVKLLKNQITLHNITYGTPINILLPVVENAFKMDVTSRCRAFQCWDSLIDNFSRETNEICVPKRIKLLMIPLKMNNAKVEATALAKFHTWWHLITKVQHRLDKFINEILIAFIHFAFGKEASENRPAVIGVSQLYSSVRLLCLQAFAQMVGDGECECCNNLPIIYGKLVNTKLLASNWNDWIFALKAAIKTSYAIYKESVNEESDTTPKSLVCIWRAFVVTIAELPPNVVRSDMFDGLIQILSELTENCQRYENMSEILFALTLVLVEDDVKTKHVLINGKGEEQPLQKLISILICPGMQDAYKRYKTETMVEMLKPLTNLAVESKNADWLLNNLSHNENSLKLWTALVQSVKETKTDVNTKTLIKLLAWPLQSEHQIIEDKYAAIVWCTMYSLTSSLKSICKAGLEKDIMEYINKTNENSPVFTKLCMTMCLLKNKLLKKEDAGVLPEILHSLTSLMNDYKEFEQAIPMLVDTIDVLLNYVAVSEDERLAKMSLSCVIHVLNVIISEARKHKNVVEESIDANVFIYLSNLFNALKVLFKIPLYSNANCAFVDELREQAITLSKTSPTFNLIVKQMKTLLGISIEPVNTKIKRSIEVLNMEASINANKVIKEFASPDVKKVKKVKKKEASIVNTVVENGEEYVVVKSNWKFNPRKLTENQKEKLQKKRDDIPALYQDLSQSQDEFKLSSWKTDSQDTSSNSTSTSKSTTNNDTSNSLKNMTSADLVPNIIVNIKSDYAKSYTTKANEAKATNTKDDTKSNTPKVNGLSPKKSRSPRMALKDRVFRNVRNLIEKSSPRDNTKQVGGEFQVENVRKSPPASPGKNSKLFNSVSLIPADRPHRIKRIPKKFNDVQLFGFKKRRGYENESQSTSLLETNVIDSYENSEYSDNTKNIDEANVSIDNTSMDHEIVSHIKSEVIETVESVQDIPDSDMAVTQHDSTKDALDKSCIEDVILLSNKDDIQMDLQNDNVKDNIIDEVAQDSHTKFDAEDVQKNESKDTVSDHNVTGEINNETEKNKSITLTLKTPVRKNKEAVQKSITKGKGKRKSRIEKELAIDTVEGHPFLKTQSEKRLTRKQLIKPEASRRKSVNEKLLKKKSEAKIRKEDKIIKEKDKLIFNSFDASVTVEETQERNNSPEKESTTTNEEPTTTNEESTTTNEDAPCSEDVIESSQDSSFTTISVKRTPKRQPVVALEIINVHSKSQTGTQDLLQESDCVVLKPVVNKDENQLSKDDIEFSQNKTANIEKNQSELTENMDTELVTDDVIVIDDDDGNVPMEINTEKSVGEETQELAEADTQPNVPANFTESEPINTSVMVNNLDTCMDNTSTTVKDNNGITLEPNKSLNDCSEEDTDVSSPFKDDAQRKKDFLNNTSEISPIKVQSPDRGKTSPSQEISSDYVVVKLTSPVQINGEPFEKSGSPEFFSGEKVSPDERDLSPPRVEVNVNSGSPSSSLSLKKNRPQALRPSGRAAHMLGLCVPDSLNTKRNSVRVESDEKGNTSTPARRNLRVLYNAEHSDISGEQEERDNFLKFKKNLPSTDSSPSVPILKRKHTDIVDESTASPAGKKKRVSFHDPPVSTTVSVQKYIEPGCIKSPSSASKRLERQQIRTYSKSPKRLENTFVKLDTVLSKAVESFTEEQADTLTNDTTVSLDVTPAVEVVNTSELNDIDPICPDLVDCTDSIENIAAELSSPAMKDLLIKELEGKVCTVGDLAKLTELEVNRLCIKAPKVPIAKKALNDYVNKRVASATDASPDNVVAVVIDDTALATEMAEEMTEMKSMTVCIETQTDSVIVTDAQIQTRPELVKLAQTQTNIEVFVNTSVQTVESGSKTTSEIISTCLSERDDFVDRLSEHLDEASMRKISEKLPTNTMIDILANQCDYSTPKLVLSKLFDRLGQTTSNGEGKCKELSVVMDYLCDKFDNRDLVWFSGQLFQKMYDKPA